ncbi:MAG TPA: RNA-binding domain-containing protein [Candidatus Thermoplasmatota archaeon]|nr:RNA-binding domain-containing protein [Candidatus Thermoplasmatota archaeon]
MLRIRIRATVNPTEDPEKVRRAIVALFPGALVQEGEGVMVAEATDLGRLTELVRSERIPDSARGVMLAGLSDDGMSARFRLGKQAAAAGRAHFGPLRSPLGDLEVTLLGDEEFEVERAIYRVAHDTTVEPEWAEVPPALRPQPG